MAKLTDLAKKAGLNAGAEIMAKMMKSQDIRLHPELSTVFTIKDDLVAAIARSMRDTGYDKSQPLVLWKGQGYVVDGHTRLKAALEAEIPEVPVVEKDFETLEDALRYTFSRQAERRNLTQAEIFQAATRLDLKESRDGSGRSGESLAKDLGVSESTIIHARTIAARGAGEDIEAVKKGELSINQAYQKVRQKKDGSLALHPSPVMDTVLEETGGTIGPDIPTETGEAPGPEADIFSGEEPIPEPSEHLPDYPEIGDSSTIRFLRSSVILLSENGELPAANLLINHFLKKGKRDMFLKIVPPQARERIKDYQSEGIGT
jgi:ParB family chromosome partitioning protein